MLLSLSVTVLELVSVGPAWCSATGLFGDESVRSVNFLAIIRRSQHPIQRHRITIQRATVPARRSRNACVAWGRRLKAFKDGDVSR